MKISFIYPRFEKFLKSNPDLNSRIADYFLADFTTPPSLGIPILAALTPPDVEIELIDDNSGDPLPDGSGIDLAAINCFTPQATRAFALGDYFRQRGVKVVMGGFFPSFMAEECLKHADAVNIGEGELTWPRIVEDARNNSLKRVYKGGCSFDLSTMKTPRRDLFYSKDAYDWDEDLVQITRGCCYNCAMCSIPAHMGSKIRFRPIDQVVEEIGGLKYENVYLADDTLFFPHRKMTEYARALLTALIPLNKKYFVSSTMALNVDSAFLDLMASAGVKNFYCTLNVDPLSIKALTGGRRERELLIDLVKKLRDRDINFFASCALGREWDEKGIAGRIVELLDKADIHTAEFFLFTPYPGSVHWDRLTRQHRITDTDWAHYNGAHVVFKPQNMSADELNREYIAVWNDFFSMQKESHTASMEPATWDGGRKTVGKPLRRQGVKGQAVITGVGILSPIGNDPDTVTQSLRTGATGLGPITRFDATHFRTNIGGEVRGFDPRKALSAEEIAEYDDRYLHYAIFAARAAAAHAGLTLTPQTVRTDIALVLGTCNGGLLSAEEEYKWINGKGDKIFNETMNLQAQYYGMGKALSRALGIGGETWIVTTACSSTTGAAGLAAALIGAGLCTTVIVGGADSLCVANMSGFNGLKATATGATAPFSTPVGLNIGEGAAFWVVEDMEQAMLRHAKMLGKIAGHALTCDAYHPTSPDPRGEGVCKTLTVALEHAGLTLEDIGCINAHGTGTEANDRAESRGIAKFIGDRGIAVTATKSFFGHCMGSTGIMEATCNLLAMNAGFIPPTINFSTARPGCTLDYVPNTAREKQYHAFLSANYAFGGNNAAIAVTKWDVAAKRPDRRQNRVVITGAATVTALGAGIDQTLKALHNSVVGIGGVERLGLPALHSKRAGLVLPFKASAIDRRLDFTGMNLLSAYATSASSLALTHANLRIGPKNADSTGICMGVCNGPPESDHMNRVFSTPDFAADISCFSNITANSTAGWVSRALCLKGVNMSVAPGPHAGLQSLAYAWLMLGEGRAQTILAAAADEIYPQSFYNYDLIGFLRGGIDEEQYRLDFSQAKRKVIGEGAATLVVETLDCALQRKQPILGEVLGYGMSMDGVEFSAPSMSPDGLKRACFEALSRSGVSWTDIGCVVWAPQGNAQDQKALTALEEGLGQRFTEIPLVTTTFNTGYIETASILVSIACCLENLKRGLRLWPQITGLPELDRRSFSQTPEY
ncbi:MAG TPA: beta-ketoacyl synthase N-terminal-like domain-containing protein, partial [Chitinivibrionales bacterium]